MDLIVSITVLRRPDGTRAARIVVTEGEKPEPLHEATNPLDAPSRQAAEYQAMLHAIDAVRPMNAQSVEFRCASRQLIDQITGVEMVTDETLAPWYDRVEAALLKISGWHISSKYA